MPRFSNLEWFSLESDFDVGLLAYLEEDIGADDARRMADHVDALFVDPFCARSGWPEAVSSTVILNGKEADSLDGAIADMRHQLNEVRQAGPALAAVYVFNDGSKLAPAAIAGRCRSAVLLVANHALADGLNLASMGHKRSGPPKVTPIPTATHRRGVLRGLKEVVINGAKSIGTADRPYEPRHVIADVDRSLITGSAKALGVGVEAMIYALAYDRINPPGTTSHWIDKLNDCFVVFRGGAIRTAYEPFLKFGFSHMKNMSGIDLATHARQLEIRLRKHRMHRDEIFISGQTAVGFYRRIASKLSAERRQLVLHKQMSNRLLMSLFPQHAKGLLPPGTAILDANAMTLGNRGILCIIQGMQGRVRFCFTVDAEIADRLDGFGPWADGALGEIVAGG